MILLSIALVLHAGKMSGAPAPDTASREATKPAVADQRGRSVSPTDSVSDEALDRIRLMLMLDAENFAGSADTESLDADTSVFSHVVLRPLALDPPSDAPAADTGKSPPRDTTHHAGRPRVKAITYSDAYATRLTIHRIASYTMVPLFIGNYVTGTQLLAKGRSAPAWALHGHGPLATAVTALFTINTVTGLWNLWDARHDPAGRTSRTLHGLLLLIADGGFAYTGYLSGRARTSNVLRHLHRQVALTSMGVAMLGYVIMLPPFHK